MQVRKCPPNPQLSNVHFLHYKELQVTPVSIKRNNIPFIPLCLKFWIVCKVYCPFSFSGWMFRHVQLVQNW